MPMDAELFYYAVTLPDIIYVTLTVIAFLWLIWSCKPVQRRDLLLGLAISGVFLLVMQHCLVDIEFWAFD